MKGVTLQFVVCRYVPDVVRDEAINIGLVLHSPGQGILVSAFSQWISQRTGLVGIDLEVLCAVVMDLEDRFGGAGTDDNDRRDPQLLFRLHRDYCNQIQFSSPRPFVANAMADAREHLIMTYVTQ